MSDVVSWMLDVSIKPGQLDSLKQLVADAVRSTRDEPNTLIYEFFLSEDNTSCHIYERYADSAAALVHVGNFVENIAERFMSCVEIKQFNVYGNPNAELRGALGGLGAKFLGELDGFAR